jgi:small-conductance mechanosensitive channel
VIVFDRPFELGDFLIFGDILGSVERIGVKTTRLRSLGGELIVVSNSDLTNSRVRNYKKMERRRVVFKIGVVYGTSAEHVKEIPSILQTIVEREELAIFDRAHFASYGDWSLIFEVVYNVASPDYNLYMDVQQRINVAIYEAFAERGIEFAFPTQTVHLERGDS